LCLIHNKEYNVGLLTYLLLD